MVEDQGKMQLRKVSFVAFDIFPGVNPLMQSALPGVFCHSCSAVSFKVQVYPKVSELGNSRTS